MNNGERAGSVEEESNKNFEEQVLEQTHQIKNLVKRHLVSILEKGGDKYDYWDETRKKSWEERVRFEIDEFKKDLSFHRKYTLVDNKIDVDDFVNKLSDYLLTKNLKEVRSLLLDLIIDTATETMKRQEVFSWKQATMEEIAREIFIGGVNAEEAFFIKPETKKCFTDEERAEIRRCLNELQRRGK